MLFKNIENSQEIPLNMRVKKLLAERKFEDCHNLISEGMKNFPHSPEPHNLMGLLLECEGNHIDAMKHFRASWDLDPTYLPARYNIEVFGSFYSKVSGAYSEEDCPPLLEDSFYNFGFDEIF